MCKFLLHYVACVPRYYKSSTNVNGAMGGFSLGPKAHCTSATSAHVTFKHSIRSEFECRFCLMQESIIICIKIAQK